MEKNFGTDDLPLYSLLEQIERGDLQLPDFQRGWVWDDDHIRSLLASISLSFPVGAVMTLDAGNPNINFKARVIEGVTPVSQPRPKQLLLDGQQRLTSLFQALKSRSPTSTKDSRGRELECHYYANIGACIDPNADREEDAIISVPADRLVRSDFGRVVDMDLSTQANEIKAEMFPLDIILDSNDTTKWQIAYFKLGLGDEQTRVDRWMRFQTAVVNPFRHYGVPIIRLAASTPKEAVCQVFEKVNTGGIALTVFELLTATYAAGEFELRKDWEERRERLGKYDLLHQVDATRFLQAVTLLATYDRRQRYRKDHPGDERAPAISCKRRDVLRLSLDDYRRWAEVAERGFLRSVAFLHKHHIFRYGDLPYATQLVPLGAVFGWLKDRAEQYAASEKLARWFWCGVLGEMYGGATETRFASDLEDLVPWIEGRAKEMPRTIQGAQLQDERVLTLRTRGSAAYKGLYALQMQQGALDFKTGCPIEVNAYMEDAIDIHHIFPRKWCVANGIDRQRADCIVNKAALDAHTNRHIGGDAPSIYISRLEKQDGMDSDVLDGFLRSHDIDPIALRKNDFDCFFRQRFESLLAHAERAMGKPINRSPHRDESPFVKHE